MKFAECHLHLVNLQLPRFGLTLGGSEFRDALTQGRKPELFILN